MTLQTPSRRESLLRDLATQAAAHPRIEAAVLGAIRAELPQVIESLLVQMFPGEQVRLYVPQRTDGERAARHLRVQSALASGAHPAAVAKAEGLSVKQVRRIGAKTPPAVA